MHRRFYIEDVKEGDTLPQPRTLKGDEARHLRDSLRVGKGETISIFNGRGSEFLATVLDIGRREVLIQVTEAVKAVPESPLKLTLILGLTKGAKPELVLQKATELGVSTIIFYEAVRSVKRHDSDGSKLEKKQDRFRRVTIEALKQSGRSVLPEVSLYDGVDTLLESLDINVGVKVALHCDTGKGRDTALDTVILKDVLNDFLGNRVCALIGPEGGLSDEELSKLRDAGFTIASAGPRVMRAETAAIAIASIIQYACGDMGAPISNASSSE